MNLTAFLKSESASQPHMLLLGNPVGHSLSPRMHNMAARFYGLNVTYHAVSVSGNEMASLAAHFNRDAFLGANITIPHKQVLMEFVDELDSVAEDIGAINTIVKTAGRLKGYNTDIYGFTIQLKPYMELLEGARAIVFGTGGASKAIVYGLLDLGLEEIIMVSRNPDQTTGFEGYPGVIIEHYDAWTALADEALLIVNATPLGMEPNVKSSPVRQGEEEFLIDKICYDIVYKPLETRFLKQAASVGAQTIGGLDMLIQQGSRSFELWTGHPFPLDKIRDDLYEYFRS